MRKIRNAAHWLVCRHWLGLRPLLFSYCGIKFLPALFRWLLGALLSLPRTGRKMITSRRCWVGFALFPAFAVAFTVCMLRLCMYDVPFFRGDHAQAAQLQFLFPSTPADDPNQQTALTPPPPAADQALDGGIRNWQWFCDRIVGDRVPASYNVAMRLLEEGKWPMARTALQRALLNCCDKGNGRIKPQYLQLACQMQVYIGLTYEHEDKLEQAADAYDLAADLYDRNMFAIYNAERLQEPSASGGGSNNDGKDPAKPDQQKPGQPKPKTKI